MCDTCQKLLFENEQLSEEVSGLMSTTRKQARSIAGLERELRRVRREEPGAKDIEFVLTRWKRLTGHAQAKTPPDGKRWKLVRHAIKEYGTLQEVLEAIEGLVLAPYMHYGKRALTGPESERRDDIEHALSTETRFEDCRSVALRARGATVEQLLSAQRMVAAQDALYARILLDALAHRDSVELQVARQWHYTVSVEGRKAVEYRHELDENGRCDWAAALPEEGV